MFKRKTVLSMVVLVTALICLWKGVFVLADSGAGIQAINNSQVQTSASIADKDGYKADEIIVKFKRPVSDTLEKRLSDKTPLKNLRLTGSLDVLSNKHKVKAIEPIFKGFKANRQKMNNLMSKNKNRLTANEKRLLRRLQRAPKNAEMPELDRIYLINLEPGQSAEQAVADYSKDPAVEYAELNYKVSIFLEPSDQYYPIQWALNNTGQLYPWGPYTGQSYSWPPRGTFSYPPGTPGCDINAPEAWDFFNDSSDVVVAVIDTGVDYTHRDLQGNLWQDDYGNYGFDFFNNDTDPIDDCGHGTHCAGIISARNNNGLDIAGVSWNAQIMSVKFLNSDGFSYGSIGLYAIYYAVENGADVLSNSWGGPYSQALQDAVTYTASNGAVFVAAAGNSHNTNKHYPAACDYVISVASTDSNDDRSPVSTYGDWVDIAAPGEDILSLKPSGITYGKTYDEYTTVLMGTSMACPHVSGACALLLAINPTLSIGDVNVILMENADLLKDETICASGRLNVDRAIRDSANYISEQGSVSFDSSFYNCDANVVILLTDKNLAGQNSYDVNVETDGGDFEELTISELEPHIGVFRGSIHTVSGTPNPNDGYLQVEDGNTITVKYYDANDGTGNPVISQDTAEVDCVSPVISNLDFDDPVIGSFQTISFQTNEETTAQIVCGKTCGSEEIVLNDSNSQQSHSFTFQNMDEATYYFKIEVLDQAGNITNDTNNGNCYNFVRHDIRVPADYGTIQEAIDAARNFDIIVVSEGTYFESIDLKNKLILVRSTDPNDWDVVSATIIDGDGAENTIVSDTYDQYVCYLGRVSGFTITGGNNGATCGYFSWLDLTNCIITGNTDIGVKAYQAGLITLQNCNINNNNNYGIKGSEGSEFNISYSSVSGNHIGIQISNPITVISNCSIFSNDQKGVYVSDSAQFTIKNSLIYGNGNGFEVGNLSYSTVRIYNCTIVNNTNYGITAGQGEYFTVGIKNCILWNNEDDINGCTAKYSCISDCNEVNETNYNICSDPCFVDDANDFHLKPASLCIDAGDPNSDYSSQTDIDGEPREQLVVDIGADEVWNRVLIIGKNWYSSIQDAINDAVNGDEIVVYPAVYKENVVVQGKTLNIHSYDPNNWDIVAATVIDGNEATNTVYLYYSSYVNLSGFTITGGHRGVYFYSTNSTVSRCIIEDCNRGVEMSSSSTANLYNSIIRHNENYGIKLGSTSNSINNNLIYDNNEGVYFGGFVSGNMHNNTIVNNSSHGIYCGPYYASCNVKNSILWNNGDDLFGNCTATFCCIEDNDSGNGNIHDDPCFIDTDFFHIDIHSPCLNKGDGTYPGEKDIDNETRVIDANVDMGADEVNCPGPDAHWWKLDETSGTTAYDSIDSNNGIFNGDDPSWVTGKYNGACDFKGVSDYFSVTGLNNSYSPYMYNVFSVAGWFRTTQSTGIQTIVGNWAQKKEGVAPGVFVNRYFGWQVLVENKKLVARFGAASTSVDDITGIHDNNDVQWHHFALVFNTMFSDSYLYLDGQQEGTPKTTCGILSNTKFRIGDGSYVSSGDPVMQGGPFCGTIDDIMIFDRVLTDDEVEQLYNDGL